MLVLSGYRSFLFCFVLFLNERQRLVIRALHVRGSLQILGPISVFYNSE